MIKAIKNHIPLVDLQAQYHSIRKEIDDAIQDVISNSAFIGGKTVKMFEESFANYCGTKHCIGVGNGTDALYISLKCLGIGAGDEVVTVPNSFVATAEAISLTGARPVFVDVDKSSYNMDPFFLERLLERCWNTGNFRIKAIVPVHLYGQPCRMDRILDLSRKYGLHVIEDAAQAHGARVWVGDSDAVIHHDVSAGNVGANWKRVGSMGILGCFSFYPGKNLGAYGDGGAIVTDDDRLAEKIRMFSNHGRMAKYDHAFPGVNSRLDALHAAVLKVKLNYIEDWTERRRQIADQYSRFIIQELLPGKIIHPVESSGVSHVYHLYVVRISNRDRAIQELKENGVSAGIHYPVPLHLTKAYSYLGHIDGDFPVSEKNAKEVLSIPLFPEMTNGQILYICELLKNAVESIN